MWSYGLSAAILVCTISIIISLNASVTNTIDPTYIPYALTQFLMITAYLISGTAISAGNAEADKLNSNSPPFGITLTPWNVSPYGGPPVNPVTLPLINIPLPETLPLIRKLTRKSKIGFTFLGIVTTIIIGLYDIRFAWLSALIALGEVIFIATLNVFAQPNSSVPYFTPVAYSPETNAIQNPPALVLLETNKTHTKWTMSWASNIIIGAVIVSIYHLFTSTETTVFVHNYQLQWLYCLFVGSIANAVSAWYVAPYLIRIYYIYSFFTLNATAIGTYQSNLSSFSNTYENAPGGVTTYTYPDGSTGSTVIENGTSTYDNNFNGISYVKSVNVTKIAGSVVGTFDQNLPTIELDQYGNPVPNPNFSVATSNYGKLIPSIPKTRSYFVPLIFVSITIGITLLIQSPLLIKWIDLDTTRPSMFILLALGITFLVYYEYVKSVLVQWNNANNVISSLDVTTVATRANAPPLVSEETITTTTTTINSKIPVALNTSVNPADPTTTITTDPMTIVAGGGTTTSITPSIDPVNGSTASTTTIITDPIVTTVSDPTTTVTTNPSTSVTTDPTTITTIASTTNTTITDTPYPVIPTNFSTDDMTTTTTGPITTTTTDSTTGSTITTVDGITTTDTVDTTTGVDNGIITSVGNSTTTITNNGINPGVVTTGMSGTNSGNISTMIISLDPVALNASTTIVSNTNLTATPPTTTTVTTTVTTSVETSIVPEGSSALTSEVTTAFATILVAPIVSRILVPVFDTYSNVKSAIIPLYFVQTYLLYWFGHFYPDVFHTIFFAYIQGLIFYDAYSAYNGTNLFGINSVGSSPFQGYNSYITYMSPHTDPFMHPSNFRIPSFNNPNPSLFGWIATLQWAPNFFNLVIVLISYVGIEFVSFSVGPYANPILDANHSAVVFLSFILGMYLVVDMVYVLSLNMYHLVNPNQHLFNKYYFRCVLVIIVVASLIGFVITGHLYFMGIDDVNAHTALLIFLGMDIAIVGAAFSFLYIYGLIAVLNGIFSTLGLIATKILGFLG
jgi:hypothetical protein